MIEVAIRQYLADNLEDIAVVMEQPKNPPKEYILLRLVDSGRTNHIDAATLFITVISNSLYGAIKLKEKVKDILYDANGLDYISHASAGGESATLDSANKVYQYTITFNFYYYREETNNG
jgi:hypothetical protein